MYIEAKPELTGPARIGRDAPRVVVQRRHVGRVGDPPARPDGQHQRRELALAEGLGKQVVGLPRRQVGGQDGRVGCVEAGVQEGRAQQQQQRQRGHEEEQRPLHHAACQPCPGSALHAGPPRPAHGQAVEAWTQEGEHGRQQRQRRGDRQPNHDRPVEADRAQHHEVEQHQPDQPEQHGQPREEDRPPGGGDGRRYGLLDARRAIACGKLFAEAARHQQRVVDAQIHAATDDVALGHARQRRALSGGDHLEAGLQLRDAITVTHPHI